MKMKTCEVGLWRLPGVVIDKEEITPERLEEMDAWAASAQGVGKRMTETLWSFKKESQRDWFILKWSGDE
jgi:hypothetical protein